MMGRRTVATTIVAALTTTLLATSTPSALANGNLESEFVAKINAERASRGLRSLSVKSDLVAAARRHSARMADKGTIWHNDNLGNEIKDWRALAENVGMGPSVDSLHRAFMDSKGHRDNILYADFREVGIGVVKDGKTIYVTQVFAWRWADTDRGGSSGGSSKSSGSSSPTVTAQGAITPVAQPAAASAPAPKPRPEPKPRSVTQLVRVVALDG